MEKRWSAKTGRLNDHIFSEGRQLENILDIHRSKLKLIDKILGNLMDSIEVLLREFKNKEDSILELREMYFKLAARLDKLEGKK